MRNQKNENNNNWKGQAVSYKGLHRWISDNFGKAKDFVCEFCEGKSGSTTMNWANLDGQYTRERNKWATLCKICHSRHDQEKFRVYSSPKSELHKQHLSESKKGISINVGKDNPMYGVAPWNKGLKLKIWNI